MRALILALVLSLPWFGFVPEQACHQPHHTICHGAIHREPVGRR